MIFLTDPKLWQKCFKDVHWQGHMIPSYLFSKQNHVPVKCPSLFGHQYWFHPPQNHSVETPKSRPLTAELLIHCVTHLSHRQEELLFNWKISNGHGGKKQRSSATHDGFTVEATDFTTGRNHTKCWSSQNWDLLCSFKQQNYYRNAYLQHLRILGGARDVLP